MTTATTKEAPLVGASAPAPLIIPGQLSLLSEPELSQGPRPCRCDHPLGIADEWYGTAWIRCLLCGRTVEEVNHG